MHRRIRENVVCHFPIRVFNALQNLSETIMSPAICHSSRVNVLVKYNSDFAFYTDIIKKIVGDSYFRILTTIHFPSTTGYHRFNYSQYRPIQQFLIESITIRLVTKNGVDVLFEESDIPSVVILHIKRSPQRNKSQFVSYNKSMYTVLRELKWRWCW